jgi:hypothetical protein
MNKMAQIATVAFIGLIAGLAGGVLAASLIGRGKIVQPSADVVRAKQFEAVGANGTIRARFGLDSGDIPIVRLFGPDGNERFSIMLDNVDEPIIAMSDVKGNTRAYLGHETSDTANPEDDDWSLPFQAAGDVDRLAAFGMMRSYPSRKHRGIAVVRDERGHWSSLGHR